ncbi:hypothetical protein CAUPRSCDRAFT_11646, partial [Caulochytrium protostelioides]
MSSDDETDIDIDIGSDDYGVTPVVRPAAAVLPPPPLPASSQPQWSATAAAHAGFGAPPDGGEPDDVQIDVDDAAGVDARDHANGGGGGGEDDEIDIDDLDIDGEDPRPLWGVVNGSRESAMARDQATTQLASQALALGYLLPATWDAVGHGAGIATLDTMPQPHGRDGHIQHGGGDSDDDETEDDGIMPTASDAVPSAEPPPHDADALDADGLYAALGDAAMDEA